MRAAVWALI
jgi:hypothetical protein